MQNIATLQTTHKQAVRVVLRSGSCGDNKNELPGWCLRSEMVNGRPKDTCGLNLLGYGNFRCEVLASNPSADCTPDLYFDDTDGKCSRLFQSYQLTSIHPLT